MDYLGMPSIGDARPVLYVEGELPASDIQIRVNGMFEAIVKEHVMETTSYISSLQQQLKVNDKGFTPIQTEQGLIEIENAIVEIKKRTGKMPIVFIDNISCLASGLKENDADAWSPIINKFVKWKNMGSTIFYFHHLNKGNDSSGSTMQHRTIDMVIRMRKT
jgi:RecA-family ATPase